MSSNRFDSAFRLGKTAALNGEVKSKYSFSTREERTGFDMGYYAGLKELIQAQKQKEKQKEIGDVR